MQKRYELARATPTSKKRLPVKLAMTIVQRDISLKLQ